MDLDSVDHPGRFFSLLVRDLKSLAISNIQFFQNGKQSHHAKFHVSFSLLYEYLDVGIEPSYRELSKHLHLYDFSPEVKGNGYRSLLQVVHKCCLHLLQLSRYISSVKDSMLFRKRYYAKELEAYVSALGQLRAILYYALKLLHYCQEGELFADDEKLDNAVADSLMMEVESLNQECFYGRCLGFQFCESMMRPVQIMNIAMVSYSEGYLESSSMMQVATSVFNSGKYFLDPELRAAQLAKVTRTADIKFCKAFWSISESGLVQQLPSVVCPSVEVNEFFPLGPDAFELPLVDGSDTVVITPPCAHVGPGHVMVRLLSSQIREGQQTFMKSSKSKSPIVAKPRTPGLVIHIHGGGFIAQSSKSHEMYLRDWARILDIPILSVDYSLAPELPFPRALEDCFYAYSWAVKNCHQLGSLGERIVMCGDSAGGNLAISTAMRAASFGIRRPDGVVGVYPVTMVRYLPSPARLLSLMDPILPVGIVSRCLAAYAGINEEHPLASPSTQEFQSESSLDAIKMQTAESNDNEWVIIGQDKDECDQIGQRIDQSPTSTAVTSPSAGAANRSVIDSLEDSYTEDSESTEVRRFHRSNTLESDEVEIFSQLQEGGSCVFNKDGTLPNCSGLKQDTNEKRTRQQTDKKKDTDRRRGSTSSKDVLTENLMSIQETAKSVMEGAQNMFTSLSSLIPSRVSAATTVTNPKTSISNAGGKDATKSTDFYVNRSISSDTVDPSGLGKSDDEEGTIPNASKSDEASFDESCVSEEGAKSQLQESSLRQKTESVEKGDLFSGSVKNESQSGRFDAAASDLENDDNYVQIDDEGDGDSQNDDRSNVGKNENINDMIFNSSLAPSDKNLSFSNNDSTHIDQNDQSPHLANRDHNFDSILSPSSDNEDDYRQSQSIVKPSVGLSPVAHSTLTTSSSFRNILAESETTTSTTQEIPKETVTKSLSLSTVSTISSSSHDQNLSSPHQNHDEDSIPSSADHHSSAQNSPVPFSSTPTTTGTVTASQPNLEKPTVDPQNQEGLQATSNNSTADSLSTQDSLESEQFLTPDDHERVISQDVLDTTQEISTTNDDNNDNAAGISNTPSSTSMSTSENSETHNVIYPSNIHYPSTPSTTTTTSPPKPPSDLNLFPTNTIPNHIFHASPPPHLLQHQASSRTSSINTKPDTNSDSPAILDLSNLSPSPNQIFSQNGNDSDFEITDTDTDTDSQVFQTSCLEFLGPSPTPTMPNDGAYYSSQHVLTETEIEGRMREGVVRSESSPAFSALLSPVDPATDSKGGNYNTLPLHNGFKMGMSPSDFKRQTFTPHSPVNTMRKALVVRNPYMSPLMAEAELLEGLPPVCIVASHLDPLLDDSVMFAKRLQRLNMPVELHLFDDLPHGFLNFSMISQEAKKASQFCANKVLDMINQDSSSSSSSNIEDSNNSNGNDTNSRDKGGDSGQTTPSRSSSREGIV